MLTIASANAHRGAKTTPSLEQANNIQIVNSNTFIHLQQEP